MMLSVRELKQSLGQVYNSQPPFMTAFAEGRVIASTLWALHIICAFAIVVTDLSARGTVSVPLQAFLV